MSEEIISTTQQGEHSASDSVEKQTGAEKTFTQDEVNRIVQSRLAKERERFKPLIDSDESAKDLIQRERDITRRELRLDAMDRLRSDNLPNDLIELFNFNSRGEFEDSYSHVSSVIKPLIQLAVNEEVDRRLRGTAPKCGHVNDFDSDPIRNAFGPPKI